MQRFPTHTCGKHQGCWGRGGRRHGCESRTCWQISYCWPSAEDIIIVHTRDPNSTYRWYSSANHIDLILPPIVVITIASSSVGIPRWVISKMLTTSLSKVEGTWSIGLPIARRCRRQDTLSRVMVITQKSRWKDDISWCHLSTRAFTKPLFAVGYHAMTRLASPTTPHKPSPHTQ